MSAFEKGQKRGCWQELNCLISIPTLNIYLKVKLKPSQNIKGRMCKYNVKYLQWASPTKVLGNSLGTWIKDLRSSQTPSLSWASESTQSPRKTLWWQNLQKWCLLLQPGWAQDNSVQLLSHQIHQAGDSSPKLNGLHLLYCDPRCATVQGSSFHYRSWHLTVMQEWCLCFGCVGGMFDRIIEKMLTTLETEASCRPSEQFRCSTSFSIFIPEEVSEVR